jgi:hypothetical protein
MNRPKSPKPSTRGKLEPDTFNKKVFLENMYNKVNIILPKDDVLPPSGCQEQKYPPNLY